MQTTKAIQTLAGILTVQGILAPGQNVFTNMIVPAKTGSVWRASIEFWAVSSQDLKKAQADAERFGTSVVDFCPRPGGKVETYNDEWHN